MCVSFFLQYLATKPTSIENAEGRLRIKIRICQKNRNEVFRNEEVEKKIIVNGIEEVFSLNKWTGRRMGL